MLTLTEFLLARIAEDEQAAERGGTHPDPATFARDNHGYLWVQPARVLAECEAKRRIVELVGGGSSIHRPGDCQDCDVMRLLALPYADHPDYREEWKP